MKKQFKAGDKVRIRQWDDMTKEFGLDGRGYVNCKGAFTIDMKDLCGKEFVIKSVTGLDVYGHGEMWNITTDMIEHVEDAEPIGIKTVVMMNALSMHPDRQYKRISDGLIIDIKDGKYHWESGHEWIWPDDRWVEVEREKEVSFVEAVKAFDEECRTIICNCLEFRHTYIPHKVNSWTQLYDERGGSISAIEILKGRWFIKEPAK